MLKKLESFFPGYRRSALGIAIVLASSAWIYLRSNEHTDIAARLIEEYIGIDLSNFFIILVSLMGIYISVFFIADKLKERKHAEIDE